MSEFKITQWCDFVRGVADPEMAEEMHQHLDSGSKPARRTDEALRRVAAVGRSDHESPVPTGAVRIAKATFGRPREDAEQMVRRNLCRLVFDSLLEPAAAGARGFQDSHRELTFEAEGYAVDLRLERETDPPAGFSSVPPARRVVVGQLLKLGDGDHRTESSGSPSDEASPVSRAPVFMFSGEQVIGKAVTGRHGEFQIEGSPVQEESAQGIQEGPLSETLCIVAGEDYLEMPLAAAGGADAENAP